MKLIGNYQTDNSSMAHSDNNSTRTVMHLKAPKKVLKSRKQMNWDTFMDIINIDVFNGKLSIKLKDCAGLGYEEFWNYIKGVSK